jgi:CheY-like chemotaxis protein
MGSLVGGPSPFARRQLGAALSRLLAMEALCGGLRRIQIAHSGRDGSCPEGVAVTCAERGKRRGGADYSAGRHYDRCPVTDYVMPGMSGAALIEEVRRIVPDLPVLMMTGLEQPEGLARASCIQKPFQALELAARLAILIPEEVPVIAVSREAQRNGTVSGFHRAVIAT